MVKLISHKIAPEVMVKPLGEGFGACERGNHFEQFYGPLFKLRRDYFPATLLAKKSLDEVHVLSKTPVLLFLCTAKQETRFFKAAGRTGEGSLKGKNIQAV